MDIFISVYITCINILEEYINCLVFWVSDSLAMIVQLQSLKKNAALWRKASCGQFSPSQ